MSSGFLLTGTGKNEIIALAYYHLSRKADMDFTLSPEQKAVQEKAQFQATHTKAPTKPCG
jgi:hypothetical protein